MIIINEKKFNRLWTIARYAYGLYPIIIMIQIIAPLLFPNLDLGTTYNNLSIFSISYLTFIYGPYIVSALLGILILTYSPRWGAYLMAASIILFFLADASIALLYIKYPINNTNFFNITNLIPTSINFYLKKFMFIFGYLTFGLLTEIKETARQQ